MSTTLPPLACEPAASRLPEPLAPAAFLAAALDDVELSTWREPDRAYERAVSIERSAATLGVEELRLRALLVQADVQGRRGQSVAGVRVVRSVNRWAAEHGDRHLLARSHRLLAIFTNSGDDVAFLDHALRAVDLLDDTARPALRADHETALANAQARTDAFDAARERYASVERYAVRVGDIAQQCKIINNLAYLEHLAGDHQRAVTVVERLIARTQAHGLEFAATHLYTIARVFVEVGRYDEAEAVLRALIDDAAAVPATDVSSDGDFVAEYLLTLAEVQRRRGSHGRAAVTLDRCRQTCQAAGHDGVLVRLRREQAAMFAARGSFAEAYAEHQAFFAEFQRHHSVARDARAKTLQAVFDAEQARRSSEHYQEMSLRDPLTGLYNRRFVDNRLPTLLELAAEQQSALSVAFIDLDHFKRVNDTLSHEVGDQVLRQFAELLTRAAGPDGFAARMGGEEFLLVLPAADHPAALAPCEGLQASIRGFDWSKITGEVPVRASVGLTTSAPGVNSQHDLLAGADRNVYAAKTAGRDQIIGTNLTADAQ